MQRQNAAAWLMCLRAGHVAQAGKQMQKGYVTQCICGWSARQRISQSCSMYHGIMIISMRLTCRASPFPFRPKPALMSLSRPASL